MCFVSFHQLRALYDAIIFVWMGWGMKKYKINTTKINDYNGVEIPIFPKYATQLINLIAGTAQATRPNVVGQLSKLFPQYSEECKGSISIEGWKKWYLNKMPNAIENSTRKIMEKMQQYRKAMESIDRCMVQSWVEDLVFNKTFTGMFVQETIIRFLGEEIEHKPSRLSTPAEESKGIDGYVGEKAYSIKPNTYKEESKHLMEIIEAYMVFYEKKKDGLNIEVEDDEDKT